MCSSISSEFAAADRMLASQPRREIFPSRETILYHLEMHPLTSGKQDQVIQEKKVNEAVATTFANARGLVPPILIIKTLCALQDCGINENSVYVKCYLEALSALLERQASANTESKS